MAKTVKVKSPRHPVPWIISLCDFRRYTYRAIAAVRRQPALIIFITYSDRGDPEQKGIFLVSVKTTAAHLTAAADAFYANRVKTVDLAKLPALRKQTNKQY
jgi:hypothetical protein